MAKTLIRDGLANFSSSERAIHENVEMGNVAVAIFPTV
jgi:hypothetical protein